MRCTVFNTSRSGAMWDDIDEQIMIDLLEARFSAHVIACILRRTERAIYAHRRKEEYQTFRYYRDNVHDARVRVGTDMLGARKRRRESRVG